MGCSFFLMYLLCIIHILCYTDIVMYKWWIQIFIPQFLKSSDMNISTGGFTKKAFLYSFNIKALKPFTKYGKI